MPYDLGDFLGACFYWCVIAIHYHFKRKKEGHRRLKVPLLSVIMDMPTGDKIRTSSMSMDVYYTVWECF